MSQLDYKIDQRMPGPFPFPNSRKGPGIEVVFGEYWQTRDGRQNFPKL